MQTVDDRLIAEFCERRSEEAFAALVRRHIDLVYATAMRLVSNHAIAQEITQNVFVTLAQSAGKLGRCSTVAGWLYRTTVNKSRDRLRTELRRARREEIAASLDAIRADGDSVWSQLVPLLDEALLELSDSDRLAIILHFIEVNRFGKWAWPSGSAKMRRANGSAGVWVNSAPSSESTDSPFQLWPRALRCSPCRCRPHRRVWPGR
jgi:RNA polymerase sigma factor (sigma-70 family)